MICPICNSEQDTINSFCDNCGHRLADRSPIHNNVSKTGKNTKSIRNAPKRVFFGIIWFVLFYFSFWLLFSIIFYFSTSTSFSTFNEGFDYGVNEGSKFVQIGGRTFILLISAIITLFLSYKGLLPGMKKPILNNKETDEIEKNVTNKIEDISNSISKHINITPRIKAIFLLWAFFHTILFLTSGNFLTSFDSDFCPFPLYKKTYHETYQYIIYNELEKYYNMPTYEEFINKLKYDKDALTKLWTTLKENGLYFEDSLTLRNDISKSINKYGSKSIYTEYNFFPEGLNNYDYSEFIIYLLLPIILFYFKKYWFLKSINNTT